MKTKVFIAAGFLLCAAACSKDNGSSGDDNHRVQINATEKMDAEQLALAAEQLETPYTFMLADKVLDMALAKDAGNFRAQFYKAFNKPQMQLRGIAKRILPVKDRLNPAQVNLDLSQIAKWPDSPLKDFLTDGSQDITNEVQIQDLMVTYRNALMDFYSFLKTNEATNITLNLNPLLFAEALKQEARDSCTVLQNTDSVVSVDCDYQTIALRKVNAADMIGMRQMVAGLALEFMIYTNYSADGAFRIIDANKDKTMSASQVIAMAQSFPQLGKLRSDHAFAQLSTFGADVSYAWKYVNQNQNTLCPSPNYPNQVQRRGYVFKAGACANQVDSEGAKYLALLDTALAGPVSPNVITPHGAKVVTMNPFLIAKTPIQDLKSITPTAFDACSNPTAWKDPSFGGVLPNGASGDADFLFNNTRSCYPAGQN